MESTKLRHIGFIIIGILLLVSIFITYATYRQKYIGACDWYGYYQESMLFKSGKIFMETQFPPDKYPSLAPLGYVPVDGKIVPQYPPGFPLIMAIMAIFGLQLFTTPLIGTFTVFILFLLLKQFTNKWIAALFSFVWAFVPIVVWGSTAVMSDIIASFFIILSYYLYKKNLIPLSALALAYSVIVRPTNVLFCIVFLPILIKDRKWFKFGLYFAIPSSLYGLYNWYVYGAPWRTGYMSITQDIVTNVFPQHFLFYLKETFIQLSPIIILLALYGFISRKDLPRLFLVAWFSVYFLFYCFWKSGGDIWWWTRFLLPAYPVLFILAASGFEDLIRTLHAHINRTRIRRTVAAILILLIFTSVFYLVKLGKGYSELYDKHKGKHFYTVCKRIEAVVPPGSIVGSIEFSGSLLLYTNLQSFLSFNINNLILINDMLDQGRNVYLAVEPWQQENEAINMIFNRYKCEKVVELREVWEGFYLYRLRK